MSLRARALHPNAVPSPKGLEHARIMELAATYPNAAVMKLHQRYGDVFAFGFGPIRFHWFVGPEPLKFVLEQPELFTLKRAYSFLYPIVGDHALITSDEPEHLVRRRQVQPAFHGKQVGTWLELATQRAHTFAAQQPLTFDLYAKLQPHILSLICELLLGKEVLARRPELLRDIGIMMTYANLPFLAQQIKLNVPFTPWAKFLAARTRADTALYEELEEKRCALNPEDTTILGMLLRGDPEADPNYLRDSAISLVAAGFDTTSAALTWAVYLLLENPAALEQLKKELADLSVAQAVRAPYLDKVVKETMRLYPSAPAGLREAAVDLNYKGFHIPKGSLVAYSIFATQRQEASFPDALTFKPERWSAPPPPFSYAPFGYGARYCIGARLAEMLIKTHLCALLQYELQPAWTAPVEDTGNTVHPKHGLPIQLRAH